jgi:hypothetical protein
VGSVSTTVGLTSTSPSSQSGLAVYSDLSASFLNSSPHPQVCLTLPGAMSEARRDSTSSLQRKKPPWLKLDIPAVVPPATEEPSFLQVGRPWPVGTVGVLCPGSSP